MTAATKSADPRTRLYALLAVGKKTLAMDEDTYRALLRAHGAQLKGDKPSATTMTVPQLETALDAMKRAGFKPARTSQVARIADWRKPRIAKLNALWCALADAGIVRDRSEAALTKFCARFTRTARLEWAGSAGLNQAIEALKDWARREGVAPHD